MERLAERKIRQIDEEEMSEGWEEDYDEDDEECEMSFLIFIRR